MIWPAIGRIGQGLLIAGHAGVEADLADRARLSSVYGRRSRGPRTRCRRPAPGRRSRPAGTVIGRVSGMVGTRLVREGGLQIGHGQAGGGDHRGPVAGRNGPALAPFAHRLGAHAGQPRGGVRAAQAFDDMIDRDRHGGSMYGKKLPTATTAGRVGKFFPREHGRRATDVQERKPMMTGGCQCGAVRYALFDAPESTVCHCRMCQKAVGGPFAALSKVQASRISPGPAASRPASRVRRPPNGISARLAARR